MKKVFFIPLLLFACKSVMGQNFKDYIEVSGVIVQEMDSITPVSFTRISSIKDHKNFLADEEGFFNILRERSDTLVFQAIGFKNRFLIVDEPEDTKKLFVVITMKTDTVFLKGVTIIPFYTKQEFRTAMLNLEIEEIKLSKPISKEDIQKIAGTKYSTDGLKIRGPISSLYKVLGKRKKGKPFKGKPPSAIPKFKK